MGTGNKRKERIAGEQQVDLKTFEAGPGKVRTLIDNAHLRQSRQRVSGNNEVNAFGIATAHILKESKPADQHRFDPAFLKKLSKALYSRRVGVLRHQ
jgi:hypothetical protein